MNWRSNRGRRLTLLTRPPTYLQVTARGGTRSFFCQPIVLVTMITYDADADDNFYDSDGDNNFFDADADNADNCHADNADS